MLILEQSWYLNLTGGAEEGGQLRRGEASGEPGVWGGEFWEREGEHESPSTSGWLAGEGTMTDYWICKRGSLGRLASTVWGNGGEGGLDGMGGGEK